VKKPTPVAPSAARGSPPARGSPEANRVRAGSPKQMESGKKP